MARGCATLQLSRYMATAFRPSRQASTWSASTSSTVTSSGMLTVLWLTIPLPTKACVAGTETSKTSCSPASSTESTRLKRIPSALPPVARSSDTPREWSTPRLVSTACRSSSSDSETSRIVPVHSPPAAQAMPGATPSRKAMTTCFGERSTASTRGASAGESSPLAAARPTRRASSSVIVSRPSRSSRAGTSDQRSAPYCTATLSPGTISSSLFQSGWPSPATSSR